jgi:pyruvate dehydrogenase E2 component (dihydrolipoamide acetyltransferase)
MPQMGYDMQEGTVVRWLMAEGAEVKEGDPVAEIETDKAVVEFESYATGLLRRILVPEGTTVPVGQAIAVVAAADEELPELEEAAPEPEEEPAEQSSEEAEPVGEPEDEAPVVAVAEAQVAVDEEGEAPDRPVKASPVARKLAEEHGIDLSQVTSTGPGGRITKDDVLAAADSVPAEEVPSPVVEEPVAEEAAAAEPVATEVEALAEEPEALEPEVVEVAPEPIVVPATPVAAAQAHTTPSDDLIPLSRMRQQISRVTVRSKQEKPHFYISADIDMTKAMQLRQQINRDLESEGVRVTVNDLIIKASVEALKKYPKFNAYLEDDGIRMNDQVNVGVAIAEEEGLIVPAIMDCGGKSLRDIASASKDLAARATAGSLHPQEYTGGTFAISNLGMFEVTSFAAIIHPPQTAVVAVGTVTKKPVVKDDEIVVAQIMTATLSADHRIVDGAEGARFLIEVKEQLQNPLTMVV